MKRSAAAVRIRGERVTILGIEGRVLKLVQADQFHEQLHLRHVEVRETAEGEPAAAANALREMVEKLDRPLGRCLLSIPRSEVLVRYAKLPATDPDELRRLATYQMHGELPFPVEECVIALQSLATDDTGTRVFLAVAHRPVVDRLVAAAKLAGLVPEGIAVSTEGVVLWAGRLWGQLQLTAPECWIVAAVAGETVELGVVAHDQLVFMRRTQAAEATAEQLAVLVRETITAYGRELPGTTPEAILVIGAVPNPIEYEEQLHERLGQPVHVVDPGAASLWEEPLTTAAMELLHEVELVDLLGVAVRPRQLALDLLPVEIKQERLRTQLDKAWRGVATWAGAELAVLVLVAAVVVGRQWLDVRQLQRQVAELEPKAAVVQAQARAIETGLAARQRTEAVLGFLAQAAAQTPSGFMWSAVTIDPDGRCVIRGTTSSYDSLFSGQSALAGLAGVRQVTLQTATERQPGQVEFELFVQVSLP